MSKAIWVCEMKNALGQWVLVSRMGFEYSEEDMRYSARLNGFVDIKNPLRFRKYVPTKRKGVKL